MSDLRFVAKPTDALAPKIPPIIPEKMDKITIPNKIRISAKTVTLKLRLRFSLMYGIGVLIPNSRPDLTALLTESINIDMVKGIMHSSNASSTIKRGVIKAYFLYCLTLFKTSFIFCQRDIQKLFYCYFKN